MNLKSNLLAALGALLLLSVSLASYSEEMKGVGESACGKWGTKKAYREATEQATRSAIRNWLQSHPDDFSNFERVEGDIYNDIQQYQLEPPRIHTYKIKETGMCRSEVVVNIDTLKLRRKFLSASQSATKKGLTFVFVAREKKAVTHAVGHTYERQDGVKKNTEKESLTLSETKTIESSRSRSQVVSDTQYNEEVEWRLEPIQKIDPSIKQEFIRSGYLVAEAAALIQPSKKQFNPDTIKLGYLQSGDVDASIINSAIEGLKAIDGQPVKLLATAALDVDSPKQDLKTGNMKVSVTVSGKVFDIESGGFFTVGACSVLGIGEGENVMTAKHNALSKAAANCAKQMVGQMSGNNHR